MKITPRKIIRYAAFPGIAPMVGEFLTTGFSQVAFFMAQVYRAVRLLPAGHPYLSGANVGRFGIRHVIAEAARHLKFSRSHIDQIIIFGLLLLGIVILFMQLGMLGLALFVETARAMPVNFAGFFVTPDATNDISYVLLDRIFGVRDVFTGQGNTTTCVAQNIPCFQALNPPTAYNQTFTTQPGAAGWLTPDGPWPSSFHLAFHQMLQFYSIGLLIVAVLMLSYLAITVIMETAQTGTPFGKRFNHVWAPLRIVAALGLLIPLGSGLNSAQYITLYAAKWGAGFATNGWNIFTQQAFQATNSPAGARNQLVATPNTPELTNLLEFFTVAATCWAADYDTRKPPLETRAYLVKDTRNPQSRMYVNGGVTYRQALQFYDYRDVIVRFGTCQQIDNVTMVAGMPVIQTSACTPLTGGTPNRPPLYNAREGYVHPLCGEVALPTSVADHTASPGSFYIQEQYFELIKQLWLGSYYPGAGPNLTGCPATLTDPSAAPNISIPTSVPSATPLFAIAGATLMEAWGLCLSEKYAKDRGNQNAPLPTRTDVESLIAVYKQHLDNILRNGVVLELTNPAWAYNTQPLGWGGAAIWYNKIAQMNGAVVSATHSLPHVRRWPVVMEKVKDQRLKNDNDIMGRNAFMPYVSGKDNQPVLNDAEGGKEAVAMWHAYNLWTDMYAKPTNNIFIDTVMAIFGLEGLYSIHCNANIHPLAQLSTVGKSLVDAAIRNIGFSLGSGVGGGVAMIFQQQKAGGALMTASDFFHTISMVGLTAGFVLFYVIPFLPFVYFFFAVAGWVKGIFEAIVGVPLWALAHLHIDGEGFAGEHALGGYFMILEIFLRPILIVFGLLGSILIFAAQVRVLNEVWTQVTSNLTGFDTRVGGGVPMPNCPGATPAANSTGGINNVQDIVSQFFFTVLYTIVVYLAGVASFKMVKLVPDHIMRWMGASVQTFNDASDDPAQNLVRNTSIGTGYVASTLGGAREGAQGMAKSAAAAVQKGAP